MGNLLCYLMERKNARSLTPHPFVHKYRNYGTNNESFSEPVTEHSEVYRMKHFTDSVVARLSETYYYKSGNTVANLRALCQRRGDAPAVAYRPVVRLETVMVPDPQHRGGMGDSASAGGDGAGAAEKVVARMVTHHGDRVVISYAQLWRKIECFGVGLEAMVRRCQRALRPERGTDNGGTTPVDGSIGRGGGGELNVGEEDESTAHVPRRPQHRHQRAPLRGMRATRVAIFADTRWEWIVTIFALWTQRFVAVTVYANLGEEALSYALEEAACDVIVCHGRSVPALFQLMQKGRLPWSAIVYLDELPDGFVIPLETSDGQRMCELLSPWAALVSAGETAMRALAETDEGNRSSESAGVVRVDGCVYSAPQLPESNDHLALIMYTSGTTGKPKGVMHTHGSIVAGVQTLNDKLVWIEPYLPKEDQTYCAFLPLAHIMEFVCINIFLHRGFLVCFSNPRTLTSEFARPHGDFQEYKPLIIMAVPRIYDVLRKSVLASLPQPGSLKRRIFSQAFASRHEALRRGYDTPYYNAKVFAKIRQAFGGRMVLMLSGGGMLSQATHEFVNVAVGLAVAGYGLTETVACGATQMIGSLDYDNVGELMKTCEIQLRDTPFYRHTDQPEPRGEILLRGPFLFKGYYKQPELTKEALDEDGWFHTGDIGSIARSRNNVLRVVGRVKALAKNVSGEYIPMEALEAIYAGNELSLPNSTCLLVHPLRRYVCALALTERKLVDGFLAKAPALAARLGTTAYPAVLEDPIFQAAVAESFRRTALEAKRQPFELVRHVRLLSDEWTPENDMLTAALKLKRRVIDAKYADIIVELFKDEEECSTLEEEVGQAHM